MNIEKIFMMIINEHLLQHGLINETTKEKIEDEIKKYNNKIS